MINKVILIGNVGADPEIRTLESGVKVARLRIATSERIYNRETQEAKEHTEWHNITLWRNMADVADRFVRKGSQIYIEGKLRSREWTDAQGNKRYTTEIVADDLKLLGRRPDSGQGGQGSSGQGGSYAGGSGQSGHSGSGGSGYGGYGSQGGSNQGSYSGQPQGAAAGYPPAQNESKPIAPAMPDEDPDDLPF